MSPALPMAANGFADVDKLGEELEAAAVVGGDGLADCQDYKGGGGGAAATLELITKGRQPLQQS